MMALRLEEFDDSVVSFEVMALVFLGRRRARAAASPMGQAPPPVWMKDSLHLVTERCTTAVFSSVCGIKVSSELKPARWFTGRLTLEASAAIFRNLFCRAGSWRRVDLRLRHCTEPFLHCNAGMQRPTFFECVPWARLRCHACRVQPDAVALA